MSWQQLLDFTREAKQMREEDAKRPIVECPICFGPLQENSKGEKACGMGHWRSGGSPTP